MARNVPLGMTAPARDGVRRVEAAAHSRESPERVGDAAVGRRGLPGVVVARAAVAEGCAMVEGRQQQRARFADCLPQGVDERQGTALQVPKAAKRRMDHQPRA